MFKKDPIMRYKIEKMLEVSSVIGVRVRLLSKFRQIFIITLFSCLFGFSCKNIKSFWQKNTEIVLQLCKLNNHLNFYLSVQLECKLQLHSKELKLKYKYFRTKIPSNFLKQKYYIFECCLFCKMRNYKFDYCRHNPIPLLPPIYSTWYSFFTLPNFL